MRETERQELIRLWTNCCYAAFAGALAGAIIGAIYVGWEP